MSLEDLGYNKELGEYRKKNNLDSFGIGRVISEHKDRYTVKTEDGEFDSELIGHLRFTATNRNELPYVGDWVSISEYDYRQYRKKFNFDQLCASVGDIFKRFLEYYEDGNEDRIITELKIAR